LLRVDNDYDMAEANLTKALSLVRDCEAAYLAAPDKLRRQFNQASFKRLLIDDDYPVTGELAEPFESDELRQAAARKAEAELSKAVDEVFRDRGGVEPADPELALTSADYAPEDLTAAHSAQGLKMSNLVGRRGLEPLTPCASCKCATNCANGPGRESLSAGRQRSLGGRRVERYICSTAAPLTRSWARSLSARSASSNG
jgi:site-specific DNA recombinase